jgi:hypothetical protein
MKSLLALALLGTALTLCNFGNKNGSRNSNNSNNTNNANNSNSELSVKDRFLGTWEATADTGFSGGPVTFRSDNTYTAKQNKQPNTAILEGTYEIRGDRLYCKGDLEDKVADGFKLEGERISANIDGKTVYFRKQ